MPDSTRQQQLEVEQRLALLVQDRTLDSTRMKDISPSPAQIMALLSGVEAADFKLALDCAPSADDTVSGITAELRAAETLVYGDFCYVNSNNRLAKCDANAEATSHCTYVCAEVAGIATAALGTFLRDGYFRHDAFGFTPGGFVYLSTIAGAVTQTAPSGSGDCIAIVGLALTSGVLDFRPDLTIVEHT